MSQKKCKEEDIQLLMCKVGSSTKAIVLHAGYSFHRGLNTVPHWCSRYVGSLDV